MKTNNQFSTLKCTLGILFLLVSGLAYAQPATRISPTEYIEMYKDAAQSEMRRTGIPASITLAQGLLESGSGNSKLCREANNHFGIKCKAGWTGPSIRIDDDTKDECFRAYDNALASYTDHSDFLKANVRYSTLFNLQPTDYKGWAEGLKRAGYATNPKYPQLLIESIERNNLAQYDDATPKPATPKSTFPGKKPVEVGYNPIKFNGMKAYVSRVGDSYTGISEGFHIMRFEILKYNDVEPEDTLVPGTVIYLKPKKRMGALATYVVGAGEGMYFISQKHGIKLKNLYRLNLMSPNENPEVGQTINLRKKRTSKPMLASAGINPRKLGVNTSGRLSMEVKEPVVTPEVTQRETYIPKVRPETHTVSGGQTLYAVSGIYGLTVEELQLWNKLTSPGLKYGQVLVLYPPSSPMSNSGEEEVDNQAPPQDRSPEVAPRKMHTVVAGETLYGLSKKYSVKVDELRTWNNIEPTGGIKLGQSLYISREEEEIYQTQSRVIQEPNVPQAQTNVVKPSVATPTPDLKVVAMPQEKVSPPTPSIGAGPSQPSTSSSRSNTSTLGFPLNQAEVAGTSQGGFEALPAYHSIAQGETLLSIAKLYSTTERDLRALNNLGAAATMPAPGTRIRVP